MNKADRQKYLDNKYRPRWVNKSWGRKSGFKGKTTKHSVDYDRKRDERLVKLHGDFDREDLLTIIYELEVNYSLLELFTPKACKTFLDYILDKESLDRGN